MSENEYLTPTRAKVRNDDFKVCFRLFESPLSTILYSDDSVVLR